MPQNASETAIGKLLPCIFALIHLLSCRNRGIHQFGRMVCRKRR